MARPKKGVITDQQERFCNEYLIDLNGTQAAIRAGYSPFTANEQASRLLANVNIRARIDSLMAARSMRTEITADVVIRELARVAFVKPLDVTSSIDGTVKAGASDDDTAAIQSVKVKTIPTDEGDIVEREIKLHDKVKALELLGKHLKMFTDKMEVGGPGGGAIPLSVIVDYGDDGNSGSGNS